MEIHGSGTPNFDEKLRPLFEAMKAGKRIKSVTCMAGEVAKDDRSKDFKVEDFIAEDYWIAMCTNYDGTRVFDFVDANKGRFYMSWVLSFEL